MLRKVKHGEFEGDGLVKWTIGSKDKEENKGLIG